MGFDQVVEAEDGSAAWVALEAGRKNNEVIDFVISDWNMPKMSGIELLQKCRAEEAYKTMPFVMVTAESEQKQILEAIKLGCNDYIVKPFSPQMIKEKINRVYAKISGQTAA